MRPRPLALLAPLALGHDTWRNSGPERPPLEGWQTSRLMAIRVRQLRLSGDSQSTRGASSARHALQLLLLKLFHLGNWSLVAARHRIAWLDSTIVTDRMNLYMYEEICGRSMNMYRHVVFLLTYKKLAECERYAPRFEPGAQSRTHLSSLMASLIPDATVSSQSEHRGRTAFLALTGIGPVQKKYIRYS